MGIILDLRPIFEEKRVIDASIRLERCSSLLLKKALEWHTDTDVIDAEPENDQCVIPFPASRRFANTRPDRASG
jgi:hypothetical protein